MIGHPVEALEDPVAVVERDSRPVVANGQDGDEPVEPPLDLHVAARRRELQRVCREVRDDLLDAPPVAGRRPEARRQIGRQVDPLVDRDWQQGRGNLALRFGDGERPDLEAQRPGLEAGDLQQVADELAHRADDRAAPLEELAFDGRVVDLATEDQLEIAAQAGQRRSQLVGHGRDEGRSFDVAGSQRRKLALGGELARDERERDGRMAGHRRRQAFGQAVGIRRSAKLEAQGEVARAAVAGTVPGSAAAPETAAMMNEMGARPAATRRARVRGAWTSSQAASASAIAGSSSGSTATAARRSMPSATTAARRAPTVRARSRSRPASRSSAVLSEARTSRARASITFSRCAT